MPPPAIIAGTFLSSFIAAVALPRAALPIIALIGSTVTLQWSADEYFFLSTWQPLNKDRPSPKVDDGSHQYLQLGRWYYLWSESWGTMFPIVALPMTLVSGARLTWLHYHDGSSGAVFWAYGLGLVLAFAHVPAGNSAFPLVGKLRRAGQDYKRASREQDDATMKHLQTWTGMHWKRTLLIDVPAVIAFATGLYLTLRDL